MSFKMRLAPSVISVRKHIRACSNSDHVQQVAFSTYHDALTQVCFSCGAVRTNSVELENEVQA